MILLGIVIPFFVLPFIHYHPETTHSHSEHADTHQHEGRYHSTTLEAYAHLLNGHFSDPELENHFHHSHSSEEQNESDTGFYVLAKSAKSIKQGLILKHAVNLPRFEVSSFLVSGPIDDETIPPHLRFNRNPNSSRAPPSLFI